MSDKLAILDTLIARLESQLRDLNARHSTLLDAMIASPGSVDDAKQGQELLANRTQAAAIEQQLASFQARRAETEEQERENAAAARRAEHKDATLADAAKVRELAQRRVAIGRNIDKGVKAIGAALAEIADIDAEITKRAAGVARVAYLGVPNGQLRLGDVFDHARTTLLGSWAANALVHQLQANGVGSKGIEIPMLFGYVGTVRAQSVEHAFTVAVERADALMTGWLHQAFGAPSNEPDQVVRVRATEDGYDGIALRTIGEVFDFTLKAGHELPGWVKRADGVPLSVPEHRPGLTTDDVRAMNPGSKVHAINPSNPLASVQPSAPTARRAGGAR